jgi:YbbR domain-containing protein
MKTVLKNWKVKILALSSALIFWVFIISIQNTFHEYPEAIQIQPFNLPTELSVVNDLGEVKMTLDIEQEEMKNLVTDDFTAYVDLQGMGVGESMAEILVTSKNSNVKILKTEPSKIQVVVEEIDSKQIPLKYKLKGEAKEGYEVIEVSLSKSEVEITGAKSTIQKIIEGEIEFLLNGDEEESVSKPGSIEIFDINGEEAKNVEIKDEEIEAVIKIQQISETKTVGVEPGFLGSLKEGWIEKITVTPQTLKIKGDPVSLKDIESIETEKIDLRTITGNSTIKTKLLLPSGVSTEGNLKEVSVKIEIETEK